MNKMLLKFAFDMLMILGKQAFSIIITILQNVIDTFDNTVPPLHTLKLRVNKS